MLGGFIYHHHADLLLPILLLLLLLATVTYNQVQSYRVNLLQQIIKTDSKMSFVYFGS